MADATNTNNLTGLARAMINHGWLSEEDADGVWKRANQAGDAFVSELIKGKRFKADQIAEFAAVSFGYPYLDLSAMDADNLPQGLLDAKLVQKRRVVALYQRGNKLYVATSDPTHLQALDEVKFQTGQAVEPVVVEDDKLSKLIQKVGDAADNTMAVLNAEDLNLDFADEENAAAQQDTGGIEIDDAPVVRYLQKIMLDAINAGASDIHFEPYEKYYRIRYRRDGILAEVAQPPMAIKDKVASRIKVLSRLDISEKRVPQDGRMKMVLSKTRAIDFRVSTLPTLYGEKIVMRILDPTSAQLGIEALGYEPWQKDLLLNAVQRPYGMVLVTGPTGSGKTVSLYTCLNILNKPDVNISTGGRPGGNPVAGHQPGQRQRQGRTDFFGGAEILPAAGSRRHHGRRNPRPGNRRHRHQGRADRPHGDVHPAHQRRPRYLDAPPEHGGGAFQRRLVGDFDYRAAAGAQTVFLQTTHRYPERSAAGRRFHRRAAGRQLAALQACRLRYLRRHRLQGAIGHLSGDADHRRHDAHHPQGRRRNRYRRPGAQGRGA